ncbi:hypothetical protein B0H12DRAFT_46317 [Mycena haematopus]|nr:hypothetical protein B0H12DRAFT_46317 [Mycena haematopus]
MGRRSWLRHGGRSGLHCGCEGRGGCRGRWMLVRSFFLLLTLLSILFTYLTLLPSPFLPPSFSIRFSPLMLACTLPPTKRSSAPQRDSKWECVQEATCSPQMRKGWETEAAPHALPRADKGKVQARALPVEDQAMEVDVDVDGIDMDSGHAFSPPTTLARTTTAAAVSALSPAACVIHG